MKIGIAIEDDMQKQEITSQQIGEGVTIQWVSSTVELMQVTDADYWIDCTFSGRKVPDFEKPTLLHVPEVTLAGIASEKALARFCAWPGFLGRPVWEVAAPAGSHTGWATALEAALGRKMVWVQDVPGLISPRVVSTIINEACFALRAGISTAEEIDVAMKLGTGYPLGPLEWCRRIGPGRVHNLLQCLSETDKLYESAISVIDTLH